MKKHGLFTFLMILFTYSLFVVPSNAAKTINVPDNYPTLQDALHYASEGDTIRVAPGIYSGDMSVHQYDVGLSIIGEDRERTILNLNGSSGDFRINADGVRISGFTILGRISISRASGVKISDNIIDGGVGAHDNGAFIQNNDIIGDLTLGGFGNSVFENNITKLTLSECGNNNILENNIGELLIIMSPNNYYKDNIILNHIFIYGLSLDDYLFTMDYTNLFRGRPIYILTDQNNLTIDAEYYPEAGFLAFINSKNVTIRDRDLKERLLFFAFCDNCNVNDNVFLGSRSITFIDSSHNNVENNLLVNSTVAISFLRSNYNIITNNSFHGCNCGISLEFDADNNTFTYNSFTNNNVGINYRQTTNDNTIHTNNFINNTQHIDTQPYTKKVKQYWDAGYNQGNFWSDYDGVDADGDGIGDTPYIIDEANQDNYPLMNPMEFSIAIIEIDEDVQPPVEEPSEPTEEEGEETTSEETTQPTQETEEPEESTETESDKPMVIPGFPVLAILFGLILGLAMTRRR